jgi:amino acid adenylation domain-containing protein
MMNSSDRNNDASDFWRVVLADSDHLPFPSLPPSLQKPTINASAKHEVTLPQASSTEIELSILLRAAWALVAGRMSNTEDVIFGLTTSQAASNKALSNSSDDLHGLNPNVFPFRIQWSSDWVISRYLEMVKQQAEHVASFEDTGLKSIALSCPGAENACSFQTLVEIDSEKTLAEAGNRARQRSPTDAMVALHLRIKNGQYGIEIQAGYDKRVIDTWMAQKLLCQFELVLDQLCRATAKSTISEINMVTKMDLSAIWERNKVLSPSIQRCIHTIFEEQAQVCPEAIALQAWDGEMTYGELSRLSTALAGILIESGIGVGILVPVCFEKSMWAVVSLLGILKAGAAFVLLDPSIPLQRMAAVIESTRGKIALSSRACLKEVGGLVKNTIVVEPGLFNDICDLPYQTPVNFSAESLMYVVYTSGSTGLPKGAMITHQNLASAMFYEKDSYRLDSRSRIYDFSSYGFIVSIVNMFNALCSGACICIPSEEDKRNRLVKSINSLRANIIHLTPSTAKLLSPDDVPTIRTVVFSGEGLHTNEVEKWWGKVDVMNVYGQSECAPRATINDSEISTTPLEATRIGRSFGHNTWVVDPRNHNRLVPVGSIGELLLEGPQVGLGYLADPEKTAASFIADPNWLVSGPHDGYGRCGRMFKTGDLVKSTRHGILTLIGRKDAQVKIRGQRVELGEVEHRILECISEARQVVAEAFVPKGSDGSLVLAVFLLLNTESIQSPKNSGPPIAETYHVTAAVQEKIRNCLPSYMIPSIFFSVAEIPKTTTNKIDRRQLREIGASHSMHQLVEMRTSARGPKTLPNTPMEKRVQTLWSQVLNLDPSIIGLDDSFLELGGESIAAMRAVSEGARMGIDLSVAIILESNSLKEVADGSSNIGSDLPKPIERFGLLSNETDLPSLLEEAAKLCDTQQTAIMDVYPCTSLQEGLFSLALASKRGDYVAQFTLEIPDHTNLERLCQAFERVVEKMPILRTRIIPSQNNSLLQVVLNEKIHWITAVDLDEYLQSDRERSMGIGQTLSRYALIKNRSGSVKWLTWSINHALYDGWSFPILIRALTDAYNGSNVEEPPPFNRFIKYIQDMDNTAINKFWQQSLMDYDNATFPQLPPSVKQPFTDTLIEHRVDLTEHESSGNVTMSALIRAAWGIVMGNITGTTDVVFGMPVSGRAASVSGIDMMTGPTLATVPVRVQWQNDTKLTDFLASIQRQAIEMIPFEQTGLRRIAQSGPGAERACEFQTLVLVHPNIKTVKDDSLGEWNGIRERESTYALMLEIQLLSTAGFTITASCDSRIIKPWVVRMLLERLEHVSKQLLRRTDAEALVGDIEPMTQRDLDSIWARNHDLPAPVDDLMHKIIQRHAIASPDKLAICAWDGDMTYGQLDKESTKLAWHLVDKGVESDQVVPICFEKSMWTSVAMLAVLKAGGGFVLVDAALPEQRLAQIMEQVKPRVLLTSDANLPLSARLSIDNKVIKVDEEFFSNAPKQTGRVLPDHSPESLMYVVFTSGSTGTPKGVMLSHRNFASAVRHQEKYYREGTGEQSRVYDFASYSFDVAVLNVFNTWALGGCLCVPSDQDRKSNLTESINNFEATLFDTTPSIARLLVPEELPTLKMVVFGGEALMQIDADLWRGKVKLLNSYGPSECTPNATFNDDMSSLDNSLSIGVGAGQVTWIVDPDDHNTLLAPGCVGELLLEGPLVGLGYLNEPEKTAAVFVDNPPWLLKGSLGRPGRQGRLYKTGDLVQYNENGSLGFLGRKDMQVKIRGQRVELGEVEVRIRESIDQVEHAVTEVIVPSGKGARPTLAAFLYFKGTGSEDSQPTQVYPVEPEAQAKLREHLPTYMIPSVFFRLSQLPMTPSGKINRKQLRETGASFTIAALAETRTPVNSDKSQPRNQEERDIQHLWSQVLGLEPGAIGLEDNFFELGGDSIAVMRMVSAARKQGIEMQVADVLLHSSLVELADDVRGRTAPSETRIEPFDLIEVHDREDFQLDIASMYNWDPEDIQDIYQCTKLQEGLLSLSSKLPGDYIWQQTLELSPDVPVEIFRAAWEKVFKTAEILRTRIIQDGALGSLQVVLGEEIEWIETSGLTEYQQFDRTQIMEPGDRLVRFALVKNEEGEFKWFVWTIHHALYDGWSMPLILNAVTSACQGNPVEEPLKFNRFIKYVKNIDSEVEKDYWQRTLEDFDGEHFPSLTPTITQAVADETLHAIIDLPQLHPSTFTVATLVRAAWALSTGLWRNTNDVVFGAAVSGRNAPVPGIETLMAPTLATVPVRIKWSDHWKVADLLEMVNQQHTDMIPFEQTGLRDIAKVCAGSRHACQYQTFLAIQPRGEGSESEYLGQWQKNSYSWSGTYALELLAQLETDKVKLEASFDSRLVKLWMMKKLLLQFQATLQQLASVDPSTNLSALNHIPEDDLDTIWRWNKSNQAPAQREISDEIFWVVDAEDHNRLVPIGAVGELLIEGKSSGRMPGSPEDSYVQNPTWLLAGTRGKPGRHGSLYKTNDLFRYDEDGSVVFVSRKKVEIRIDGEPIDLAMVERCTQKAIPEAKHVVAEVIFPVIASARPTVAIFVSDYLFTQGASTAKVKKPVATLKQIGSNVEDMLAQSLPQHMLPTLFMTLDVSSATSGGQIDRRLLRELGASFLLSQLEKSSRDDVQDAKRRPLTDMEDVQDTNRRPLTDMEKRIQRSWSKVLDVDLDSISLDDNFFQLGGDSIEGMRMVSVARRDGVKLTLTDLFRHPRLADVAIKASYIQSQPSRSIPRFSLLGSNIEKDEFLKASEVACGIGKGSIEDAYPCTQLQSGLMSLSSRNGDYVTQFTLKIFKNVDLPRFRKTWEEVFRKTVILRTRIVADEVNGSLVQVLVREEFAWLTGSNLIEYLESDRNQAMTSGTPLARFALISDVTSSGNDDWFVLTVHHALYDGWSLPLIFDQASKIYQRQKVEPSLPFNRFIQYVLKQDGEAAREYWQRSLEGCHHVPFPTLPSSIREPAANQALRRRVSLSKSEPSEITTSTLVYAAWSLVIGRLNGAEEVIFGTTVSGRSASISGIDEVVGPTIATVPMRVKWSKTLTTMSVLETLQSQRTEMIPFEQTGLQKIAKINADCAAACKFNTLLIIQPRENEENGNVFGEWQNDEVRKTNTYPLTLFIEMGESEVYVKASFDSRVLEPQVMTQILEQFEATIRELHLNTGNRSKSVAELATISSSDLRTLWNWNGVVPQPINTLIHAALEEQAKIRPKAQAIHSWDGDLTYDELDRLSTALSLHLRSMGVGPGVIVPLYFEKCKWVIVSLFSVLKAGGAFVLLDASLPEKRLKSIFQQFDGNVFMSSSAYQHSNALSLNNVVVVNDELFRNIPKTRDTNTGTILSPESVAYVVYTSGSTGIPKVVQVNHRNLTSAIHYQRHYFEYSEKSRFLDFASYSFDMSIFTIFHNFFAGACLCIPKDEDRKEDLPKAISSLKANSLVLTPSVSRLLKPADVPDIVSILWCGEALHSKDAEPWFGIKNIHAINTYGPSECTPVTTINYTANSVDEMGNIGHGVGVVTWVVDSEDCNQLAPIGHVGELLLEGPLVGLGYLKAPKETASAFIHDPSWLLEGFEKYVGRNGRLYRTGDLVRYSSDGSLVFMGRKNTKVKVRGQWVELGDVGYQVAQHLPSVKQVVAEVITARGDDTRPLLAAFVQQEEFVQDFEATDGLQLYQMDTSIEMALAESLPNHMMPDVYFSVGQIPMTAAGKTNRSRLRELGSAFSLQELADLRTAGQGPKRLPRSSAEIQMQLIWSRALHVEADSIGLDDNFFQLGGDSIRAMVLVGLARKQGIAISMANIFHNPKLEQLTRASDFHGSITFTSGENYEFIDTSQKQELLAEIETLGLDFSSSEVEKIFPLTDFQYKLVKASITTPPLFCNYFYLDLGVTPSFDQLERACAWTLERFPILRSRYLPIQGSFWQIIPGQAKSPLRVIDVGENVDAFSAGYCLRDSESIKVSDAPFSVFLFRTNANQARLVLRISHAQYDGISWVPIFTALLQDCLDDSPPRVPLFADYLAYAHQRRTSSRDYWARLLKGSSLTKICDHLPQTSVPSSLRRAVRLEREISLPQLPLGITAATLLSSAWGVLLSILTGSKDIVYSQLVAGRNAAISGVEDIVGPCVNIIPIRASPAALKTPASLLRSIQGQLVTVGDADSLGLRDIQEHCTDWPAQSTIDSVVVHQNIDESPNFESNGVTSKLQSFPNPHHVQSKIWVTSRPRGDKMNIEFQANTHLMTVETAGSILDKYCRIATLLFCDLNTPLEQSPELSKLKIEE